MPTTYYIWDEVNDTLLMEKDEAGNTIAEYTHEPGQFGPLISQHRNGQTRYHHFDGQGSTRQLTDANQDVTDAAVYTAFAEPVTGSGDSAQPFMYKGAFGYYTDSETGDITVRRRPLRPVIARWLSPDVIELYDGTSRYLYTNSNPINRADASGLNWTAFIENVTFGAQCQADYQVNLGFVFQTRDLPVNPVPEQVWAVNRVSGDYMDERCEWSALVFTTMTIDPKSGNVTTTRSTERTLIDVWGKQTIAKQHDIWTFDDTSTSLAAGRGTPRCMVVIRTDKVLGFNSATNGSNDLLPERSSVGLDLYSPAQKQQIQAMRGPKGQLKERYFLLNKKACGCCARAIIPFFDFLPDCVECVVYDAFLVNQQLQPVPAIFCAPPGGPLAGQLPPPTNCGNRN